MLSNFMLFAVINFLILSIHLFSKIPGQIGKGLSDDRQSLTIIMKFIVTIPLFVISCWNIATK